MTPAELSARLNRIATAIDNSKNPDRALVAAELKKLVAAMDETAVGKPIDPENMRQDVMRTTKAFMDAFKASDPEKKETLDGLVKAFQGLRARVDDYLISGGVKNANI